MPDVPDKSQNIKKTVLLILSIAVLIFLDQWTKSLAVSHLKGHSPFVLIPNILELVYVENTGAAFGMMKGMRGVFLIFAPLVSVVLFVLILKDLSRKQFRPLRICYLFLIAGALGNFIDRLKQGYVIDFIYFKPIDFPVFNVADIYVTCGAFALMILLLFHYKEEDFG